MNRKKTAIAVVCLLLAGGIATVTATAESTFANANREIIYNNGSYIVNVTIKSNFNFSEPIGLQEIVPADWKLDRISDNAFAFRDRVPYYNNKTKSATTEWVFYSALTCKPVIYRLTPYASINVSYFVNGSLIDRNGITVPISGQSILK